MGSEDGHDRNSQKPQKRRVKSLDPIKILYNLYVLYVRIHTKKKDGTDRRKIRRIWGDPLPSNTIYSIHYIQIIHNYI